MKENNDLNEGFRWNEYELQSLEWCDDELVYIYWNFISFYKAWKEVIPG